MPMEVEAKLQVDDHEPIRQRLIQLHATPSGTCRERNWVLDDPDGSLRHSGRLLRVRNTGGDDGILTVKTPRKGGAFKTREELEVTVDSTAMLLTQLQALGYQVTWIYEKIRSTWLYRDCHVVLDTMPELGCFIEVEGNDETIRQVLSDLGLDPAGHLSKNYLGLWQDYLTARGEAHRHMLFPTEDAASDKNRL